MASSSKTTLASSSAPPTTYDVFLSFRGLDTRKSITYEIYDKLQNRGIETFIDSQDLEVGDPISQTLLTAIENSRFAIVVLSPNYAFSTWCLDELVKICECMDNNRILPLFYNVNPTDVRFQKKTFEDAFAKHEQSGRHNSDKLQQWRNALKKVADFSGWDRDTYKDDRELVDAIVDFFCTKVPPTVIASTEGFTVFEATRQAMDQVMKALEDNKVTIVGVQGMGGVGKAALVEHVDQEVRKKGLFDRVIMARVNQAPDVRKIQGILAEGLGIRLEKNTEEDVRASRLSSAIMRKNKTLIILVNVWKRIDLPSIGIPNSEKLRICNSKVLLTTRIKNVCQVMRSQTITLNTLSPKDSWVLFKDCANKTFESPDFEEVARKVARECGGLPIALITVARALGDKDMEDWELAAEQLKKSEAAHIDQEQDAFICIKLSYNFLKEENCRACFLLCCLFPQDYDIRIEELFRYGVGKGLFKARTIREARKKASSVVKYLKACSLLLDSEIDGCVKMHDVVRDTAIQITQPIEAGNEQRYVVEAGVGLRNWPEELSECCTAISFMMNYLLKLPEELVYPELEILLLQKNANLDQIPDTFFKSTSLLRVLDLSYTSISSLSKSFICLSNLQGLYLDSCLKISDISILKHCEKLEILSMKEYPLPELSADIGNMSNLRVLDVSGQIPVNGGIIRIPAGVISKLRKLEELSLQCGFWGWGSKIEGTTNVCFDEVTNLSKLSTLKVCISDVNCIPKKVGVNPSWVDFDIRISRDRKTPNLMRELNRAILNDDQQNSKSLVLDTTINMLPRWFVEAVTENTERLTYENARDLNDILVDYHHGMLDRLKHLSVFGPNQCLETRPNKKIKNQCLETLMPFDALPSMRNTPVFEKLEELHLGGIGSLKELCSGELPSRSLQNLKSLKVRDCPSLGNVLLSSKLLQRITNLEHLICVRMPGMEYVFGCEGFQLEQSKLREMKFLELQAVKSICNGLAPPKMFQVLRRLYIFRCTFTGALFTFDVAQSLSKLEDIFIESCPNLERLIEASTNESEPGEKTVLEKLERLALVDLCMLDSGRAYSDMVCPSLQYFYVKKCPHFRTSADNFGSKYRVIFNDPLQFIDGPRIDILCEELSEWDNVGHSNSEVVNAPLGDELEKEMLELFARRPDIRECLNELKLNVPEGVTDIVLEFLKPRKWMPSYFVAELSKIIDLARCLESLSPSMIKQISDKFKQLPQYVKSKREINRTPQGIDATAEFIELLPELLRKIPPFIRELIKRTPPEEMHTEEKYQMTEALESALDLLCRWLDLLDNNNWFMGGVFSIHALKDFLRF